MLRDRRRHPLHEVVEIVQAGLDDRVAQRLEARDVEGDVVVDQEDRLARRACGRR